LDIGHSILDIRFSWSLIHGFSAPNPQPATGNRKLETKFPMSWAIIPPSSV
jgi:hypothetical protein